MKDVIALMNRAQTGKVYLWDPYLTVEDILHTWYFTKSMNVTLYAITSGEIAEKSKMNLPKNIKHSCIKSIGSVIISNRKGVYVL